MNNAWDISQGDGGFIGKKRTPKNFSYSLEIAEDGNYFAAGLKLRIRRQQPPELEFIFRYKMSCSSRGEVVRK